MSVIDKVEKSLKELALSDVDKCFKGGAKVGAFILLGCLIDAATGFWKGQDTTRTDYKDFVRQYLPKYDPESLYADLRCKLIHSYSEGGSYDLKDGRPGLHLQQCAGMAGKLILNYEDFYSDVASAIGNLIQDARRDAKVRLNFENRYSGNGVVEVYDKMIYDYGSETLETTELTGNCQKI